MFLLVKRVVVTNRCGMIEKVGWRVADVAVVIIVDMLTFRREYPTRRSMLMR